MTRLRVVPAGALAAALAGCVLAGCAPAPEMPTPITQAEAQRKVDENMTSWWESMFPDQPMPVVEPIADIEPGDPDLRASDCIAELDGDGAAIGSYVSGDLTAEQGSNLASFVCSQKYPTDLSDPAMLGMLSEEELAWIWSYNQSRLVPCLQLLGYTVAQHEGAYGDGNRGWWIPYYEMSPIPLSDEEWDAIDRRCPPSPVGPPLNYRPTQQ